MSADLWITIAIGTVTGGGGLLVRFTKPGFGPVAYAATVDWLARHGHAAIAWRIRRVAARRYHRHGRVGVHHHIRPTAYGRTRAPGRRALPVRTPAVPAAAVVLDLTELSPALTTLPDIRQFVRPTC